MRYLLLLLLSFPAFGNWVKPDAMDCSKPSPWVYREKKSCGEDCIPFDKDWVCPERAAKGIANLAKEQSKLQALERIKLTDCDSMEGFLKDVCIFLK